MVTKDPFLFEKQREKREREVVIDTLLEVEYCRENYAIIGTIALLRSTVFLYEKRWENPPLT